MKIRYFVILAIFFTINYAFSISQTNSFQSEVKRPNVHQVTALMTWHLRYMM